MTGTQRVAIVTGAAGRGIGRPWCGAGWRWTSAVEACRKGEAPKVFATVTHGLFLAGSEAVVANPDLEGIVVADRSLPFGSAQALPARS